MEEKVYVFRSEYKDIDLGLADNGKFLPELNSGIKSALDNSDKEYFYVDYMEVITDIIQKKAEAN